MFNLCKKTGGYTRLNIMSQVEQRLVRKLGMAAQLGYFGIVQWC